MIPIFKTKKAPRKAGAAKQSAPVQKEPSAEHIHDYIYMILPGAVKFMTDHYICGNTFRSCWAIREYPTSVTLTTISGAEYRQGSTGAWQPSPTFSGLEPNTGYTFYARLAETTTYEASPASAPSAMITTEKAELGGTVTITGTAKFGEQLSANTSGLTTDPAGVEKGVFTYQWKRGTTDIGTNSATCLCD